MKLIDSQAGTSRQSYQLAKQFTTDSGQLLRVRVHVDSHAFQSSATVDVFTPQFTWTELLDLPPSNWHNSVASYTQVRTEEDAVAELDGLVLDLGLRGATMLASVNL